MAAAAVADDKGLEGVELDATSLEQARQKYEFFWKSASPYSQWYLAGSFEVDGQSYNCAEQYMMHQKAVLFGDEQVAQKILQSEDPKFQKKMGRKVTNFDEDAWNRECINIVRKGNKAKFGQNEKLKKTLIATYPKTLVEASPVDTIWGIGYTEDTRKAWNKSTWRGQNLLGHALTDVRNDLMREEGLLT
ncbi:N-glycosidase YbiA-like [Littorina saxatilis]|uniref:NADAR domain-containing protein n=1 Tax=Littorina saxatilis TaxID=31220 RepID=A0AAN9C127_9CAEN